MHELLEYIVKELVDHPDQVEIEESQDAETIILTLKVESSDMGKIIGKEGKIIKALRTLVKIPAIKQKKKIRLELAGDRLPAGF